MQCPLSQWQTFTLIYIYSSVPELFPLHFLISFKSFLFFPLSVHSTVWCEVSFQTLLKPQTASEIKPESRRILRTQNWGEGPLMSSLSQFPPEFLIAQTKVQTLSASLSCLCIGHLCLCSMPQWSSLPETPCGQPIWRFVYVEVFRELRLGVAGGKEYNK